MNILGNSKESASDVRKEYNVRINSFLDDLQDPGLMDRLNPFNRREDPLGELLSWGINAHDMLMKYSRRLRRDTAKIEELMGNLEEAHGQIASLGQKLQEDEQNHKVVVESLTQGHKDEVDNMDGMFTKAANKWKKEKERISREHEAEKNKLIGQLFDNRSAEKEWADEKLKLKYRELQMMVENVVLMKEFKLQTGQILSSKWDEHGFLSRAQARGTTNFLLRSVIWRILIVQYFAAPFGFGALGPGKGMQELNKIYQPWLQLIDGENNAGNDYTIFQTQPFANEWRSATFQSIAKALDNSKIGASSYLAKISKENSQQTVSGILELLKDVTALSNNTIPDSVRGEHGQIAQLVELAAEIALQFGVHPSHLRLVVPEHGDKITIGPKFHHCQDADTDKGMTQTVDVVTLPGFEKIANSDEHTYVACELYPIHKV